MFFREALSKTDFSQLSKEDAVAAIQRCLRVCFLRDCRASARYNLAVVNKDGVVIQEPVNIDTNWEVARGIKGYE